MNLTFIDYLMNSFFYFVVFSSIVFVWDLIDLYIDRKNYSFLKNHTFWVYYLSRSFFGIILMELVWTINLLSISNKFIWASIAPILFILFFQNLAIALGGQEINVRDIFLKFRDSIFESFASSLHFERIEAKSQLLTSNINIENLREECRIVLGKRDFEKFELSLSDKDSKDKTLEYIDEIVGYLPPDKIKRYVKMLIKRYSKISKISKI